MFSKFEIFGRYRKDFPEKLERRKVDDPGMDGSWLRGINEAAFRGICMISISFFSYKLIFFLDRIRLANFSKFFPKYFLSVPSVQMAVAFPAGLQRFLRMD